MRTKSKMKTKELKNINVLIFFNSFWTSYSGGDHFLIQIFKRIRYSLNKIYCFTNKKGMTHIKNNVEDTTFFISYGFFDKFHIMISYILRTIKAFSCIKLKNIDLIYSSSDFFPDVLPAFIYKKFYPKTIWHQCIHLIYTDYKKVPGNKLRKIIARLLQRFSFLFAMSADIIIVVNSHDKEYLIKKGFKREKIVVIMPGVDVDYLSNLKISESIASYDGSYLARLHSSKGIYDLVEIWKIVVKKIPNAKLAVIGGGDENIILDLNKEIIRAGLQNNIILLGFKKNEVALKIVKSSKLFIFPSYQESFAIVIAEAMACKVPVIAWNLEAYEEIYQDNIFKISTGSVNLFADKVIDLFLNPSILEQKAKIGYEFIRKYNWDNVAKNYTEVLIRSLKLKDFLYNEPQN